MNGCRMHAAGIAVVIVFALLLSSGCATKKLYAKASVSHETLADRIHLSRDERRICIPYRTAANAAPEAGGSFLSGIPSRSLQTLKEALPIEIARAAVRNNGLFLDYRRSGEPPSETRAMKLTVYPARTGAEPRGCGFPEDAALVSQNDPFPFLFRTKEDRYPLAARIAATPFAVAYDVLTAPVLLVYMAVVFYGSAAVQ